MIKKQKSNKLKSAASVFGLCLSAMSVAQAGDAPLSVNVGAINVNPQSSGSNITNTTGSIGSGIVAGSDTQLGITFDYAYSDAITFELIAATPFKHTLRASGALAGATLGETKHLPPTLMAQYKVPAQAQGIEPFIGLGVNYTNFFEEGPSAALKSVLGTNNVQVELDDSFGLAAQIGANISLSPSMKLHVMAAYMDIDTDASIYADNVKVLTSKVEIDPIVAMIGVQFEL